MDIGIRLGHFVLYLSSSLQNLQNQIKLPPLFGIKLLRTEAPRDALWTAIFAERSKACCCVQPAFTARLS